MSQTKQKNIEAIYPLSPMQQGMLFHTIYNPQAGAYFEQFSCKLHGDFNKEAFENAWKEVVHRHSSLRTSYVWKKVNKMLQVAHKTVSLPIIEEDWRSFSEKEREEKIEALFDEDRKKGFNLSKAPLMRFYLIRLEDKTYHFLWSFHHLLTDGWSMPVILKEVFTMYEMGLKKLPLKLPPARPYREYINWLQKQDIEKAKSFWQSRLGDFDTPVQLKIDRPSANFTDEKDEIK